MAGVTHFERRGIAKRVSVRCRLCSKEIKATPKMLSSKEKRDSWKYEWARHLLDHVLRPPKDISPNLDWILTAIYTAFDVEAEYLRNL